MVVSRILAQSHIWQSPIARVNQVFGGGKVISADRMVKLLDEALIQQNDRIVHEGDSQKQSDSPAVQPARMDPNKLQGLNLCVSSVELPEHLDLFEKGLADNLHFSYAGPQSGRLARMTRDGSVKIGDGHTYVALYSRYVTDLRADVARLVAIEADNDGTLYNRP
jgi:malonate decarboxylase alpha subunit